MSNSIDNNATYVLFGDEAVSIYRVSIKQLLRTNNINYTVGAYDSVKEFFKEKEKWGNYIEIDHSDYQNIKTHMDAELDKERKKRKKFSFFKLFQ